LFPFIMFKNQKVLSAPGLRSACAVACGVLLSGVLSGVAWADDQLDALVVTATRTPQPINKVMADVTVIGRDVLERQASGNLGDVLRDVPGLEVVTNGGAGGTTGVFMRGGEKRHVLMLVDGVPLNTQNIDGVASLEAIPVQQIERIEVLRGAASVAYGSGGVSGVIQIFTKQGQSGLGASGGLGISDEGTLQGDVSWAAQQGAWRYGFTVAAAASRGINAKSGTQPGLQADDRDGYARQSSSAHLSYQANADHKLSASVLSAHQRAQYDDAATSTFDDHVSQDLSQVQAQWQARWTPNWTINRAMGHTTSASDSLAEFYQSVTSTRTQTASLVNQLRWDVHTLRATLDDRQDHLLDSYLPVSHDGQRADQHTTALGLGYGLDLEQVSVAINGRVDDSDSFGLRRTGSVAGAWAFQPGWRLRASTGTAFLAPTLYQLFSSYGNPALQPERSQTREVGVSQSADAGSWSLTAYHTQLSGLIQFDAGKYRNVQHARTRGLEWQGHTNVGDWQWTASLNWSSARNTDTNEWLLRRARTFGSIRAEFPLADWSLGAQARFSGRRADAYFDDVTYERTATFDGGYTVWSVDGQRALSSRLKLTWKVDNLSNHRYQTAYGFNTPGRTVFVGLRWSPAAL
jgi:vitamin B12 transporter